MPDQTTRISQLSWKPLLWSLLLLGGLLYLSVEAHQLAVSLDTRSRAAGFDEMTSSRTAILRERLTQDHRALAAISGLFDARRTVTREEFHAFVKRTEMTEGHLLGAGYAVAVTPRSRREWNRAVQREGISIATDTSGRQAEPGVLLDYLVPRAELAPVHGLDLLGTPWAAEIELARDQGIPRMSGVGSLDSLSDRAALALYPVYLGGGVPASVEERRLRFSGVCVLIYDFDRLCADVLYGPELPATLGFRLFETRGPTDRPEPVVTRAHLGTASDLAHSFDVAAHNRVWRVVWEASSDFARESQWTQIAILLLGIVGSFTLSALTYQLMLRNHRAGHALVQTHEKLEKSQEEVARTMEALRDANTRLTRADKAKTEFLSNVSHELRTPLTVIQEYVEMILKGQAGPVAGQAAEFLESTRDQLRRLNRLVNDLLDFARMETESLMIRPRFADVDQTLSRLEEFYSPAAKSKGLSLRFGVEGTVPRFWVDPDRLEQILGNLISNALKFTGRGGEVRVFASHEEDDVVFLVDDEGPGISEEDMPHLFDRFYQTDDSTTSVEGVGLGLSIALGLTRLQGGEIHLQSIEGSGTCFMIRFPARSLNEVVLGEMDSLLEAGGDCNMSTARASLPGGADAQALEEWIYTHVGRSGGSRVIGDVDAGSVIVVSREAEDLASLETRSRAVFPLVAWESIDFERRRRDDHQQVA